MRSFVAGMIAGAVLAWRLGDSLEAQVRKVRSAAADRLRAVADAVGGDRAGAPSRITRAS